MYPFSNDEKAQQAKTHIYLKLNFNDNTFNQKDIF